MFTRQEMDCPNCGNNVALSKSLSVSKQGPVECNECEEEIDPTSPTKLFK